MVSPAGAFAGLVAAVLAGGVRGHGQLTVPRVRPDVDGRTTSYRQREPVYTLGGATGFLPYSATSMRCHDFPPDSSAARTPLRAGEAFDVTWTCEACHPGDCYLYLSYDADAAEPVNFFKIADFPGCGADNGLDLPSTVTRSVTLPAELPSCEHCVLRWEWTGHQQVVNIEFYVQCADVSISSSAPATRPSPMIAIAGIEHLSPNAEDYRAVYQGELPGEQFLLGPRVATFSSCAAGSLGCIGSSAGPGDPPATAAATTPAPTTSAPSPSTLVTTTTTTTTAPTTTTPSPSTPAPPTTTASPASSTSTSVRTTTAATLAPTTPTTAPAAATPVEGTCPTAGFGLPPQVSDCFCGFVGAGGAGCAAYPDDGSACWCRCCCHFAGGCDYRALDGGGGALRSAVGALPTVVLAGAAVPVGCLLGMLTMCCWLRCCSGRRGRELLGGSAV